MLGQDTESDIIHAILADVQAESGTGPHAGQAPVSDELIELVQEIMDHSGIYVELEDTWRG